MLDLSIKSVTSTITNEKKAAQFIVKHIVAVEKIDGTKLTLVRNDERFNPKDYTKNWIIAYKNQIIYPTEFSGLEDRNEEIKSSSIGSSQYKFVHDHMKLVHSRTSSIPLNTEFFIEFVQNKPTITRDYAKMHGMFLVGFGSAEYVETLGQLYTSSIQIHDPARLESYREILKLESFPIVFDGNLSSFESIISGCLDKKLKASFVSYSRTTNFTDPMSIVKCVVSSFAALESSLGGQAEGVVISVLDNSTTETQLLKVLAADQHDKAVRSAKKQKYKGTEQEENDYWNEVNNVVDDLLDDVKQASPRDMLADLSSKVYALDVEISHPSKTKINVQEDIMLTAKLRLLETGSHRKQNIAVIPMAAKPFHSGHDSLLKAAEADGNESIIVLVSTGGREEINVGDMVPLWRDYYMPGIRETYGSKVIVKFCSSPMINASEITRNFVKRTGGIVSLYGDPADAEDRVAKIVGKNPELKNNIVAKGIGRNDTGGISGTAMRGFITSGDKKSFISNLPDWIAEEDDEAIWWYLSKNSHRK
jgi:hypothetical protein